MEADASKSSTRPSGSEKTCSPEGGMCDIWVLKLNRPNIGNVLDMN